MNLISAIFEIEFYLFSVQICEDDELQPESTSSKLHSIDQGSKWRYLNLSQMPNIVFINDRTEKTFFTKKTLPGYKMSVCMKPETILNFYIQTFFKQELL